MKKYVCALLFLGLTVLTQSCSDSGNSNSDPKGFAQGGGGSQASYTETYDLTENGCKTDRHDFASSSEQETKRQLCESLQNEGINNGCAQRLRYQLFTQKCSGYSWNPNNNPVVSPDIECVKYVAGSYPNSTERNRAVYACRNVRSLSAVQYVAGNYPNFSEREEAAQICSGNINTECVQYVAGNYPNFSERKQAAGVCHNVDTACVKYAAGNYPNLSERIAAARSCGGN
jgi:hypothetical protein